MPAPERRIHHGAAISICVEDAWDLTSTFGVARTLEILRATEMEDLREFASAFRQRHGQPLPHVAARVSVLRPDGARRKSTGRNPIPAPRARSAESTRIADSLDSPRHSPAEISRKMEGSTRNAF
jgi:hypothetical protein